MSNTSGLETLLAEAPEQARVLGRLEAGAWRAMADADLVDRFELVTRAIATQHGLAALKRPQALGASIWNATDAETWRSNPRLGGADRAALSLAEQLAFFVASTQPDQRAAFFEALGTVAVPFAQAIFVADMLPRARGALDALFGPSAWGPTEIDTRADLGSAVDELIRVVPGLQAIDSVTTELVRLLGARRHACRVCQSVRSYSAIAAGADDELLDGVEDYASGRYGREQTAALRFADGMLSSPARFEREVVDDLRTCFDDAACVELVLDITRNATNKVAVALGGDAPRVETGYEIYEVRPNGEIEYGLAAP